MFRVKPLPTDWGLTQMRAVAFVDASPHPGGGASGGQCSCPALINPPAPHKLPLHSGARRLAPPLSSLPLPADSSGGALTRVGRAPPLWGWLRELPLGVQPQKPVGLTGRESPAPDPPERCREAGQGWPGASAPLLRFGCPVPPFLSNNHYLQPTSRLKEKQSHYLPGCLHAFPEAEKQDDDDDHQTEQELPLGQTDVMDAAALVKVQDASPARGEGGDQGRRHRSGGTTKTWTAGQPRGCRAMEPGTGLPSRRPASSGPALCPGRPCLGPANRRGDPAPGSNKRLLLVRVWPARQASPELAGCSAWPLPDLGAGCLAVFRVWHS